MSTDEEKRLRLVDLGVEELADTLLKLAERHSDVYDIVERMIASPKESVKRFKSKLRGLKRSTRFISWKETEPFAHYLESMLEDLKKGAHTPENSVECLNEFFKYDRFIFDRCDDSSGWVGDVFSITAADLFAEYAGKCDDKVLIIKLLQQLYSQDHYGIRFSLIEKTHKYLPKAEIHMLIDDLWLKANKETEYSYAKRHWLIGIQSLAKQLKDAKLYESATLQMWPELSTASCMDIARVYLDADNPNIALKWMRKIDKGNTFRADEQNILLLDIYKALGMTEKTTTLAWKIFRGYRSQDTFEDLLSIVGDDKREKILQEECGKILEETELSLPNANFLVQMDLFADANSYLLTHVNELDGDNYYALLPLAECMEYHEYFLSATMLYRALMESILRRAQSKYYHHGVRYLKKLDNLALKIEDWQDSVNHEDYFLDIQSKHKRKVSFWSKYNRVGKGKS